MPRKKAQEQTAEEDKKQVVEETHKDMPKKKTQEQIAEEDKRRVVEETHKNLPTVKSKLDQLNEALGKLQDFRDSDPNVLSNQKTKAKNISLVSNVLKLAESQAEFIRRILNDMQHAENVHYDAQMNGEIKRQSLMELILRRGETLPLWSSIEESFPGEYVGALAPALNSKLSVGDCVAAYITDNWILADIVACHANNRYECRDVDDEQKKMTVLARNLLVPLPKWKTNPKTDKHALFPINAIVLALYPQTTCFYKGIVHEQPTHAGQPYKIAFEDDTYQAGFCPPMPVCQKYVVAYRAPVAASHHKKKKK